MIIAGLVLFSCILSILITPLQRDLARRLGITDAPDHRRKIHTNPVPRTGGISIFLTILVAFAVLLAYERLVGVDGVDWRLIGITLAATSIVFVTGLWDDIRGLKPWQKLIVESAAAALACVSGIQIESLAGHWIGATWWHWPLTILWLVVCTNAFNLIDGMDGLAAGVGLFATVTTFLTALLMDHSGLVLATAPLIGALVGFLRYNFNPATIFLGDCGSLSIGFLLGCFGVIWSQKSATMLGLTAPLISLSIPLLDTGLAVLRRAIRGKPIFGPDRRHIHHLLLEKGLKPRNAVIVLYMVAGVSAACALLIGLLDSRYAGLIVVLFCAATWLGVQHLGYSEFRTARHVVFSGLIGRVIDSSLSLERLDSSLKAAQSDEERWKLLRDTSRQLGFSEARLAIGDHVWLERVDAALASDCWQLRVPLDGQGAAQFSVPFQTNMQGVTLAPFVDIVHDRLLAALQDRPGGAPAHAAEALAGNGSFSSADAEDLVP
jgi:UDP-GlcNAc:undecaprenyl-phosphate GlcNAc-1-phosphate transferase